MPKSCTRVYIHFVWATWDRLPPIAPELEEELYACIAHKCQELGCELLEIGGISDHVHALVRLSATIAIADTAQGMKGSSSHLVTHVIQPNEPFKWQGSYGAFSVSSRDLSRVRAYIRNQKEHHANGTIWLGAERCEELD